MATRSMPTVSSRRAALAISVLVPTPSVAAARSRPSPSLNSPAKPPMPSTTSGRVALEARSRIRPTTFWAASRSTPACRYLLLTGSLLPALQHVLGRRPLRNGGGVLPVEAGPAEGIGRCTCRLHQCGQRQIGEGIGPDELANALDAEVGGDQFLAGRHVDPIEARPLDRRAGGSHMGPPDPRPPHHLNGLASRIP